MADVEVGTLSDVNSTRDIFDDDCSCVENPSEGCCDYQYDQTELDELAEQLLNEVAADCSGVTSHTYADCVGGFDVLECNGDGSFGVSIPPTAVKIIQLDPLASYVSVTAPDDSATFALSGSGTLDTSPSEFLNGLVWATDGELQGYQWNDWWWRLSAPLDFSVQSPDTFTVPPQDTAPIQGSGWRDTTGKLAEVYPSQSATGHFYSSTLTWDLDLTQQSYGWTIQVHMEGDYEDVP